MRRRFLAKSGYFASFSPQRHPKCSRPLNQSGIKSGSNPCKTILFRYKKYVRLIMKELAFPRYKNNYLPNAFSVSQLFYHPVFLGAKNFILGANVIKKEFPCVRFLAPSSPSQRTPILDLIGGMKIFASAPRA